MQKDQYKIMKLHNKAIKNIFKTISVTLSLLLVWQAVVWADPDVFAKNTLQPRLLFSSPKPEDSFFHMATGYFGFYLSKIEDNAEFQNVASLKDIIDSELKKIKSNDDLSAAFKDQLPEKVDYDEKTASITLSFKQNKIRYYNHNVLKSYVLRRESSEYDVVENKIGKYLTRQIIKRKEFPRKEIIQKQSPAVSTEKSEEKLIKTFSDDFKAKVELVEIDGKFYIKKSAKKFLNSKFLTRYIIKKRFDVIDKKITSIYRL